MAEDFLAQVRSLNPDLAGYDDQTLAAAIGDQHPDYKPKLAKYFPDTAANVLSAQGAEGRAAPLVGAIDETRPIIKNPGGSFSTEKTITVESDGKQYLIPTIVGGKQLSNDDAIAAWRSGANKPVGVYGTPDEAEAAAVARSKAIGDVRSPDIDPKEAARLEFAKAHEDISPWAAAEKGAAYLGSEPVREKIKTLPWGVRGAANVGAAAGQFALEQVTPENVAIAAALPLLPGAKAASAVARATPRVVSGLFAGTALYDTLKRYPILKDLYQKGDWDNFTREATKAGLGAAFVYMLTKHAIKGRAAQEQGDQAADLKAKQKVAEVLGTPEAQADVAKQQEVVDALKAATAPKVVDLAGASPGFKEMVERRLPDWEELSPTEKRQMLLRDRTRTAPVVDEMRPRDLPETVGAAPPIVPGAKAPPSAPLSTEPIPEMTPEQIAAAEVGPDTPSVRARKAVQVGDEKIVPNEPPTPERAAETEQTIAQAGVDPKDPKAVADYLTQLYGLKKPMEIASVGEKPVSVANETPDAYPIELAEGAPAEKLLHEAQHARVEEGQIPAVPEGPGANDAILDEFNQKYAGNLNLNRLDISPEAKQGIIDNVASVERQKPIPLEETLKAAKEIGMSYDEATELAKGTSDLHAQVTAARQLESHAATQFQAAKAMRETNPKAANAALDNLISAMQSSSDVAANVARALGSFNIKAEAVEPATEFGKLLAELQKKGKKTTDLRQKLMETNLEDPVQRGKLRTAMKSRKAGLFQKIEEYFVNSILSGMTTMGKKFESDLFIGLHAPIEILASYPPRMALYLAGKGEKPYIGEAAARTLGFFTGLNDGMKAFTLTMKGQSAHFTPEPAIEGKFGSVVRTPTRVLSAITDFVRAMEVRASLYKQGYTAASKEGASFLEAMDRARHSVDNPDETMLTKAHEDAAERVLMAPPGKFTSALYGMRRAVPFGRLVAPVLQLPVNVAKFAYQMSPVSWPELVYRISKGEEIPDAKLGRAVMGGALWYWVFGQVAAGKITGSGPIDPVEKQRLRSSGWQPHSFHAANGKFYPLYWAGPIGESISMAADTAEIYRDAPRAATELDLASMVAAHAGRFVLDQPYMQGLADVVKAMEDTNWAPFMVGSTIGGFIPSIVARTGAAMDPEQRKLSGMIDVVKARVPYYREELPPKRDIRGRPLPAPGTPADRFLNPMAASQQTAVSPPELVAATAKIPQVQGFIRYHGKNLTLDAVDRDRYEELAGQIVDRRFTAIEKSPSRFNMLGTDKQLEKVRDIITGARDEARSDLIGELKKRGTLAAMQKAELGRAGAHAQANPYLDTLAVPGAEKAEAVLDRYQIPPKGLPSNVPDDLADEFNRELAIDRAKFFFRVYTTPEELGVQPFDSAQAQVQQLEDIARKHAADTVLRRAGMLKAKR